MANKLLKTLTIDGVSMDINNDRFPKTVLTKEITNIQVPNEGYSRSLLYTATENCMVIGTITMRFSANNSSSAYRQTAVDKYRNGAYYGIGSTSVVRAVLDGDTFINLPFVTSLSSGESIYASSRHSVVNVFLTGTIVANYVVIPQTPKNN